MSKNSPLKIQKLGYIYLTYLQGQKNRTTLSSNPTSHEITSPHACGEHNIHYSHIKIMCLQQSNHTQIYLPYKESTQ